MQDSAGQNILIDSQSKSLANIDVVERFGQKVEGQEIDMENSGMMVVVAGFGAGKIGKWKRGIVKLTSQILFNSHGAKLRKIYLGKAETLTLHHLNEAIKKLARHQMQRNDLEGERLVIPHRC